MQYREPLGQVAGHLMKLSSKELMPLISMRLSRRAVPDFPSLARDEDPADILIDCFHWTKERGEKLGNLPEACAMLAERWANLDEATVDATLEVLGELHYLCARIGATDAIPFIAKVAERDELATVTLPGGEDVQNRALRTLAGLLTLVPREQVSTYRSVFEKALDTEHHAVIGLSTLSVFWPEESAEFSQRAAKHESEQVRWAIDNLGSIVKAWPSV